MREDDRRELQRKARPASASQKPRPAGQKKPIARPSTLNDEAYRKPPQKKKPVSRRDSEYLYPDDAYYRKPGARPAQRRPAQGVKKGKGSRKKRTNPLYLLFYTAFAVAVALLLSFLLRTFVFEVVQISGDAMYDTLQEGDWVLITKFDYQSANPMPRDIVSVGVKNTDQVVIRRVIATPGQRVEITGMGDTMIDGIALAEPYVTLRSYEPYPERTLPGSRYFVLSDNRSVTLDSRDDGRVGLVEKHRLGRVRAVVWPLSRRKDLTE